MNAWLTTQIGAEAANIVSYAAIFLAAIIVLWLIILIIKRIKKGTYVVGGKNREVRLSVRDAAPVDSKRRLVLVKRDDVEHLILIGGPTDIVIETNISKFSLSSNNTIETIDIDSLDNDDNQGITDILPTASNQTTQNLSSLESNDENIVNNINQQKGNNLHDNVDASRNYFAPKLDEVQQADSNGELDIASYQKDEIKSRISIDSQQELVAPRTLVETNENQNVEEYENIDHNDPSALEVYSQTDADTDIEINPLTIDDTSFLTEELRESKEEIITAPTADLTFEQERTDKATNTGISNIEMNELSESNVHIASTKPIETTVENANISDKNLKDFNKTNLNSQTKPVTSENPTLQNGFTRAVNQENTNRSSGQVFRSATSQQRVQDSPFGTPKPINPYKIMKAAGAFGGNNVKFNATVTNAPTNKNNSTDDQNKAVSNNNNRLNHQHDFIAKNASNQSKGVPTAEIKTETSKNSTTVLKNEVKSSAPVGSLQSVKQDNQHELHRNKDGNSSAIQSSNSSNTISANTPPSKDVSPINATASLPERSVTQRNVPQGMLRPPLMVKPRNIAATHNNNQSRSVSSAVNPSDNKAKSPQASPITTTEKSRIQHVTVNNLENEKIKLQNENSIVVNSETKAVNKPQAIQDPSKSKNVNLQKFSLQLLEPQNILDKPNRNEQLNDTKKQENVLSSKEEDEFDRRLKSELDHSIQK